MSNGKEQYPEDNFAMGIIELELENGWDMLCRPAFSNEAVEGFPEAIGHFYGSPVLVRGISREEFYQLVSMKAVAVVEGITSKLQLKGKTW